MKAREVFILSIFGFLVSACNSSDGDKPLTIYTPVPTLNPTQSPSAPPMTRIEKEKALLDNIRSVLDKETCDPNVADDCEYVEYAYQPLSDALELPGERANILVLDYGIFSLGMTGYRNRVINIFDVNGDMVFNEFHPTLKISRTYNEVFDLIAKYNDFISVQKLSQFSEHPTIELFGQISKELDLKFGHGYSISTFLMEHNPKSKFVLVELGRSDIDLLAPEDYCNEILSKKSAENNRAASIVRLRHDNFLLSIKELVENYSIDYINASWGTSRSTVTRAIDSACSGEASPSMTDLILAINEDFIRNLSRLSYVDDKTRTERQSILVQAGAVSANRDLVENDSDFPADCDSDTPNRVRVNAVENDGISNIIPAAGSSDNSYIQPQSRMRYLACTDVYLPVGSYFDPMSVPPIVTRKKSLNTIFHGFLEINFFPGLSSSSFAAPIMLSALNYQQSQTPNYQPLNELMEALTNGNTIIDPLLYDSFRVYALGYRD